MLDDMVKVSGWPTIKYFDNTSLELKVQLLLAQEGDFRDLVLGIICSN